MSDKKSLKNNRYQYFYPIFNSKRMKNLTGTLLAAVFAVLNIFHFNWAAGGSFGRAASVPTVGGALL